MNFIVQWHEELESTNTFLRERARTDAALAEGFTVAARSQTRGRGRGARDWTSPAGENLTFSILLRPAADTAKLASLPMATALAVSDLLAGFSCMAQLKWPNDVLVNDRKICGILTESLAAGAVILGIGINVNMTADTAARIVPPATSLRIITGRTFDLPGLLADFLASFSPRYSQWLAGGFASLRTGWESRAQKIGTATSRGIIAGYGAYGELLLRDGSGNVKSSWSD